MAATKSILTHFRNHGPGRLVALGFLIFHGPLMGQGWCDGTPTPAPAPTQVPIPTEVPLPVPVASGAVAPHGARKAISPAEARRQIREFKRTLDKEYSDIRIKQDAELRELDASLKHRWKEWNASERAARHKFFEANPRGADRRVYVKDFFERRSVFLATQKEEREKRVGEHQVRRQSLKVEQDSRLREFEDRLKSDSGH